MADLTGFAGASNAGPWMALPILLLLAVGVGRLRSIPHTMVWAIRTVTLGLAAALASALFLKSPRGALEIIAWFCAAVSLMGSILSAGGLRSVAAGAPQLVHFFHTNALLFGAVAFTLQLIIVSLRLLYLLIDLMTVVPWEALPLFEMGTGALWSMGLLFSSCGVAFLATREPQLYLCQLLITIMMALGTALLLPVFRVNEHGGLQGTGSTLVMVASLSLLLLMAATTSRWGRVVEHNNVAGGLRGFRIVCGVMVVVVLLLICYHFSVPLGVGGNVRLAFLIVTGSAAIAAVATHLLATQMYSRGMAEAALGLVSLAICGAVVSATPYFPKSMAERYPVVFNGMVFGLAAAMAIWAALASSPRREEEPTGASLRDLLAQARPFARRFAFRNAVLALLIAGIMAVWPRMRSIAVPDDSIGRVTSGLAGNLFLLLVLLWTSRRLGSLTFHVLTALAMISSVAFMVMRMYPYTPRFR